MNDISHLELCFYVCKTSSVKLKENKKISAPADGKLFKHYIEERFYVKI